MEMLLMFLYNIILKDLGDFNILRNIPILK